MIFLPLINVKMPTVVGILTFMSRKKIMLSLVEREKSFITSGPCSLKMSVPGINILWHFKLIFMFSFFSKTLRHWNSLTDSLISASECADDLVPEFTSVVKAGDSGPGD